MSIIGIGECKNYFINIEQWHSLHQFFWLNKFDTLYTSCIINDWVERFVKNLEVNCNIGSDLHGLLNARLWLVQFVFVRFFLSLIAWTLKISCKQYWSSIFEVYEWTHLWNPFSLNAWKLGIFIYQHLWTREPLILE